MNSYWQVSVVVMLMAWLVSPRSIGELAEREKVRRQLMPKSTALLTNAGQAPEVLWVPPAVPSPEQRPPVAEPAAPAPSPATALARDEQRWRARITAARERLERDQILADALQSRINALQADVVNVDDPVYQAKLRTDLQRVLAELARMNDQIAHDRKDILVIQDEARRLDVPPGWIR